MQVLILGFFCHCFYPGLETNPQTEQRTPLPKGFLREHLGIWARGGLQGRGTSWHWAPYRVELRVQGIDTVAPKHDHPSWHVARVFTGHEEIQLPVNTKEGPVRMESSKQHQGDPFLGNVHGHSELVELGGGRCKIPRFHSRDHTPNLPRQAGKGSWAAGR